MRTASRTKAFVTVRCCGSVAPRLATSPNMARKNSRGADRPGELRQDIAGDVPPRKVASQREGNRHGGVDVGAALGAQEVDDGHDHQAGGDRLGRSGHLPVAEGAHDRRTGRDGHEEEGAEGLGDEAPTGVAAVLERAFPRRRGLTNPTPLGPGPACASHGHDGRPVSSPPGHARAARDRRWVRRQRHHGHERAASISQRAGSASLRGAPARPRGRTPHWRGRAPAGVHGAQRRRARAPTTAASRRRPSRAGSACTRLRTVSATTTNAIRINTTTITTRTNYPIRPCEKRSRCPAVRGACGDPVPGSVQLAVLDGAEESMKRLVRSFREFAMRGCG